MERIISMESIILYQKDEIVKTETIILKLRECVIKQKEALKLLKNEKQKMEEEKIKALELLNLQENKFNSVVCDMEHQLQNKDIVVDMNGAVEGCGDYSNGFKRKIFGNVDCCTSEKVQILTPVENECNGNTTTSTANETPRTNQCKIKEILNPEIGNEKITQIVKFNEDVCLGCTGGMLLKYRDRNFCTIHNRYKDDIKQLETVKKNLGFYLLAFSRSRILIYNDADSLVADILMPGMGYVFNDISLVYVPAGERSVKKLCINDFSVKVHLCHNQGEIRWFVPGSAKNQFALISLQDTMLYKTEKEDLTIVEKIEDSENILRIMRIKFCNFLCHSHRNIWFFNSTFDLTKTVTVPEGIKCVDVADACAAVVDGRNTVHLFTVLESGLFGMKIGSTDMQGNVTAISVMRNMIMVAVGDEIVVLDVRL